MYKRKIFGRELFEFTGAIHNHCKYSFDSEAEPSYIVNSAKKAKLDFFTINDHMNLDACNDENFKNCKTPTPIIGVEIHDKEQNHHYLVFKTNKVIKNQYPCVYVNEYKKQNCIGFIAHPFEKRMSSLYRTYSWLNKDFLPVDGLEIWNFASGWMAKLNPMFNGLLLALAPSIFVRKPHHANLKLWEQYYENGQKPVAIGSTDAHCFKFKKFGITFNILSHKKLFKTIRTNVILQKQNPSSEDILQALKNGNSYICNYVVGHPYNFWAGISVKDGQGLIFGESSNFKQGMKYYFRLPKSAKVTLIKNGKSVKSIVNDKGFFDITEKGRYRLEIKRFGYGWIYTNYIFVE